MRTLLRSVAMFVVGTTIVFGQSLPDLETVRDLGLDEARSLIESSGNSNPAEFCELVFEAKRLDLLKLLCDHPNTTGHFWNRWKRLPDSEFKDQLAAVILRSAAYSRVEPKPGSAADFAATYRALLAGELFPIIRKYIPDYPTEVERLSSQAERLQVALKIEAAIANGKMSTASKAGSGDNQKLTYPVATPAMSGGGNAANYRKVTTKPVDQGDRNDHGVMKNQRDEAPQKNLTAVAREVSWLWFGATILAIAITIGCVRLFGRGKSR